MKIFISLLAGLLFGIGIGCYAAHTPKPTRQQIVRQENLAQDQISEAAEAAAFTEAIHGMKYLESGREQDLKDYFAQYIAIYYHNYISKPGANHDVLRSQIESIAATNSTVAAEMAAVRKLP
jgi:hypothetical protein